MNTIIESDVTKWKSADDLSIGVQGMNRFFDSFNPNCTLRRDGAAEDANEDEVAENILHALEWVCSPAHEQEKPKLFDVMCVGEQTEVHNGERTIESAFSFCLLFPAGDRHYLHLIIQNDYDAEDNCLGTSCWVE